MPSPAERTHNNSSAYETLVGLIASVLVVLVSGGTSSFVRASERPVNETKGLERQKVIIDTDIGDDIDDAFAVALALNSPELDILGFTTTSGNTVARARILDRMLAEAGRASIPVAVGSSTTSQFFDPSGIGPQTAYGEGSPPTRASHPDASEFILQRIRQFPGEITLITIGPLSNIGQVIDKDPEIFHKLKRVVTMGGWVAGADDGVGQLIGPIAEGNIKIDVGAAQKLFRSGVPIYLMPADSTLHLLLDEVKRRRVFVQGTGLTNSLGILYILWGRSTPVLFDPMAVGFAVNPQLCPVKPMQIVIDDEGFTRAGNGPTNAQVCLRSDSSEFFDYYLDRVAPPKHNGTSLASSAPR